MYTGWSLQVYSRQTPSKIISCEFLKLSQQLLYRIQVSSCLFETPPLYRSSRLQLSYGSSLKNLQNLLQSTCNVWIFFSKFVAFNGKTLHCKNFPVTSMRTFRKVFHEIPSSDWFLPFKPIFFLTFNGLISFQI